jgi:hypothetical protein
MSTLAAATLALLLAAEPTDVPPASAPPAGDALTAPLPASPPAFVPSGQPVAAVTASPAPSASTSKLGQVRAGLGVSVTNADDGFASTFQAGVQIDPWDHFGFRVGGGMTSSVVGAGGWDAAEATGSVLFRPFGNQWRVVPYAGLGVQFALLAVFPDGEPLPQEGMPRVGAGHLGVNFMTAGGGEGADQARTGFGGTNQFKVMPEATVGVLVRLSPGLALDVAGRYLPLFWNGTTYNGVSIIASVCAPF